MELKRKKKLQEVEYLKSQRAFLAIRAPYSGAVLTRNIESFAGKKFSTGEPFCEIARPRQAMRGDIRAGTTGSRT